jgi:hypothetical protein
MDVEVSTGIILILKEGKYENISAEDYQLCLNVWTENDMKTMKEVLTWYNNKDVEPMLEAIDKMFQLNQNRRIDMFPDSS